MKVMIHARTCLLCNHNRTFFCESPAGGLNGVLNPAPQPGMETAILVELIGKYKVLGELARGGMGIVYKAEDPNLKRLVAIKQLWLQEAEDDRKEEFRERFRREAILAANLSHPNIVSIFDVCISDDNAYYVMEFMRGITLGQELAKRPGNKISVTEFWPIFSQICKGLSHSSGMNLVHRDIKPDNVFILGDGSAKITDFGIACSTDNNRLSRLTKQGSFLGTLCYVSPEQLQDAASVDYRADIYSLAAMTYEVLSGEVPFSPENGLHTMMNSIVGKEATPLNLINPEISAEIAAVIARAMRKKPEERYVSFDEFEADFERALNAPKGSKRLLSVSGPSAGSANAAALQRGQNNAANSAQADLRGPVQSDSSTEDVKPWKRGPAKFFALTNSIPLVKSTGQFSITGGARSIETEALAICARKGKIAIADNGSKTIKIFGSNGKLEAETRCAPANKMGSKTNGGVFSKPSGVTINVLGKIFATDATDQFIRVFDENGWFLREFQNKKGQTGGLTGLLIEDREGCLYLADAIDSCVHFVRSDLGTWLNKFGSKGQGDGQFQHPVRMVMDGFGQLYVLDQESCKISVFAKNGSFQRSWGSKGSGKGEFKMPSGLAIDQADRLYVADSLNDRVLVFSSAGDYLFVFGGFGSKAGQFSTPQDLSVDLENNVLYVLDKGNRRVQIFEILMEEPK